MSNNRQRTYVADDGVLFTLNIRMKQVTRTRIRKSLLMIILNITLLLLPINRRKIFKVLHWFISVFFFFLVWVENYLLLYLIQK